MDRPGTSKQTRSYIDEFLQQSKENPAALVQWASTLGQDQDDNNMDFDFDLATKDATGPDVLNWIEDLSDYDTPMIKRQKPMQQSGAGRGGANQPYTLVKEPARTYTMTEKKRRSFASRLAEEVIYDVKMTDDLKNKNLTEILPTIDNIFKQILEQLQPKNTKETDLVRIYISHPELNTPITISPRPWKEVNAKIIRDKIEYVLTSKTTLKVEDGFEMHVGSIRVPDGSGKRNPIKFISGPFSCLTKKRSIVTIKNGDHLCLARAITVGIASQDKDERYGHIRKPHLTLQRRLAQELQQRTGIPMNAPVPFDQIKKFEDVIDRQIVVFSAKSMNSAMYAGTHREKKIYLLHTEVDNEGHFDTITSIKACLGVDFFCHRCLQGFNKKTSHKCSYTCHVCQSDRCSEEPSTVIQCHDCHEECKNTKCFEDHKKRTQNPRSKATFPSMCEKYVKCLKCGKRLDRRQRGLEDHQCGEYECRYCKKFVKGRHFCYMRAGKVAKTSNRFVFFDFECTQSDGTHEPNFVVAQSACNFCEDEETVTFDSICHNCGSRCEKCSHFDTRENEFSFLPCENKCGKRMQKFVGKTTQNDFCEWLFTDAHSNFIAIAHNARGYDAYFLIDFLIHNNTRSQVIPSVLYRGSKIMTMHVQPFGIKIVDSLNYIPMPLRKFPSAFGLQELHKGFFPHYFNEYDNFNHKDEYPPKDAYGYNTMSSEQRERFLKWYESKANMKFNFLKEIEDYCISDVDILRRACMKFRRLMQDVTKFSEEDSGIDPFDQITIASTCMTIFKTKFMTEIWEGVKADGSKCQMTYRNGVFSPENATPNQFISSDVAIVPYHGYVTDNFSKKSIQWLSWVKEQILREEGRNVFIQHAGNLGEKRILGPDNIHSYKVDGYMQNESGKSTIFEFNGCWTHACNECNDLKSMGNMTRPGSGFDMNQIFERTQKREKYLRDQGFEVIALWEHEFDQMCREDKAMSDFIKTLDVQERIKPRDSFFGGRTEPFRLHYKAEAGEKLKYIDFCSLYPYIQKYGIFPCGHPQIITSDFKTLDQYFGIAKITILPPSRLYIPVLPCKINGKLYFPLCRTCSENNNAKCECSSEDRALTGTWVILDILEAIRMGYKLIHVYEIYHFDETIKYNPATGEGGLFTPYVNLFLKIKQQASGYPRNVRSDDEKEQYIQEYYQHEGIYLEKDQINNNPALRSLAKAALNNPWGRFSMREDYGQTKIVDNGADFLKLLFDRTKQIKDFHILSESFAQIDWSTKDEFIEGNNSTNIFIAVFTTAQARLKLFSILNSLGQRALYCDTDSVIYISRNGEPDPPLGNFLGDLTDELVCKNVNCQGCSEDHFIKEFISAGAKNYGMQVNNNYTEVKVRGFSLNYTNSKLINFQTMRDIILEDNSRTIVTTDKKK